jgi:hypothetical protein
MKKEQIKRIIKPLVRECVNEVLLQEGVLSNVISEVVKGMQTTIVESNKNDETPARLSELEEKYEVERQERIKKLNESVGHNFFDNTEPIPQSKESSQYGPLSGMSSKDEGVDIDGLMAIAGRKWKKLSK